MVLVYRPKDIPRLNSSIAHVAAQKLVAHSDLIGKLASAINSSADEMIRELTLWHPYGKIELFPDLSQPESLARVLARRIQTFLVDPGLTQRAYPRTFEFLHRNLFEAAWKINKSMRSASLEIPYDTIYDTTQ